MVRKPSDFLTESVLSPEGDRVVLRCGGQVFVVPVNHAGSRRAHFAMAAFATGKPAQADGKPTVFDESKRWNSGAAANGLETPVQLTSDAATLRNAESYRPTENGGSPTRARPGTMGAALDGGSREGCANRSPLFDLPP